MNFVTRCISMPIIKPLEGDWPALTDCLNASWRCSTVAANAIISALYAADMAQRQSAQGANNRRCTQNTSRVRLRGK